MRDTFVGELIRKEALSKPNPPPAAAFGMTPCPTLEPGFDFVVEVADQELSHLESLALLIRSGQRLAGSVVGLVSANIVSPFLAGQIAVGSAAGFSPEELQVQGSTQVPQDN